MAATAVEGSGLYEAERLSSSLGDDAHGRRAGGRALQPGIALDKRTLVGLVG